MGDAVRVNFRPSITWGARAACLAIALGAISSQSALGQSRSGPLNLGPVQLVGDEASYLDFGAGAFDIQGHPEAPTSPEARVEFRYGRKLFFIGPAIGLLANTRGGVFGYGGIYADLKLGPFVLTPFGGVGAYRRGGSVDLGNTFEFRTSLAVAYELGNGARIGVQVAHVSNDGTGKFNVNPGENEILLTFAMPLRLP